MELNIDRDNFVPIYYQIGEQLRQAIEAGQYAPGEKLPPEETLAASFQVSRKTIRQSLNKLEKEGFVKRVKGKGSFVSSTFDKRKLISVILETVYAGQCHRSINDLLGGIIMTACPSGCEVQLSTSEQVESILENQRAGRSEVCGFILLRYRPNQEMSGMLEKIKKSGIPFLLEGGSLESENYVALDNRTPMKQVVGYLLELGHRRIGLLTAPGRHFAIREAAAIEAINESTGEFNPAWKLDCHQYDEEIKKTELNAYLSRPNRPTAFIAVSDNLAMSLVKQARRLGLRIPRDFSITGFDDSPEIAMMEPGLTTFRQDYFQLGKISAEMLLQLATDSSNRRKQTTIVPEFLIRGSCAPHIEPKQTMGED
jgi:GntR family transcriptional regulator of arabinose operon